VSIEDVVFAALADDRATVRCMVRSSTRIRQVGNVNDSVRAEFLMIRSNGRWVIGERR
jgi:hypothetical protein